MKRHQRVSKRFIKKDWGSGRLTWREAPDHFVRGTVAETLRRLTNVKAKKAWVAGSSLKAY